MQEVRRYSDENDTNGQTQNELETWTLSLSATKCYTSFGTWATLHLLARAAFSILITIACSACRQDGRTAWTDALWDPDSVLF